jgi:3',5'-cyclic AMP phosphodiesterase CpdA
MMKSMRVAHLSDPHLLSLNDVGPHRLYLNRRLFGMIDLWRHRRHAHRREIAEAMVEDIGRASVDHVVVTGDMTILALDPEFELALALLARLGLSPEQVSVIPGNHDVMTRGAERSGRFLRHFARHATSDLWIAAEGAHPSGPFPFVRLRGEAAIIGLSSAISRLPPSCAGYVGPRQLAALARALEHPEVTQRFPIVLVHHPLVCYPGWFRTWQHGLPEGPRVLEVIAGRVREALVLHGHLHDRRYLRCAAGGSGVVHQIGSTSASLIHNAPHKIAGYNVYHLDATGLAQVTARIWDPAHRCLVDGVVPAAPQVGGDGSVPRAGAARPRRQLGRQNST